MRSTSRIVLALSIAVGFVLGGCAADQAGLGVSRDRVDFKSTPHALYNVTIVDTNTGEDVWTIEVPLGQRLVGQFANNTKALDTGEDTFSWSLVPASTSSRSYRNKVAVPPMTSRRVSVTMRDGAEEYVGVSRQQPVAVSQPRRNPTGSAARPAPVVEPTPSSDLPEGVTIIDAPTEPASSTPVTPQQPQNPPSGTPIDLP